MLFSFGVILPETTGRSVLWAGTRRAITCASLRRRIRGCVRPRSISAPLRRKCARYGLLVHALFGCMCPSKVDFRPFTPEMRIRYCFVHDAGTAYKILFRTRRMRIRYCFVHTHDVHCECGAPASCTIASVCSPIRRFINSRGRLGKTDIQPSRSKYLS